MSRRLPQRISHSVGARLLAGLLPSIVAIALLLGLLYYGEIGRGTPHWIDVSAALLTALSLYITWANARYFVQRLTRLARVGGGTSPDAAPSDEFDRVEHVVGTLGSALSAAESDRARAEAQAAEERRVEATMLGGAIAEALSSLDEIRLPLHILLEAPFGELNENQEELLRDARAAADGVDSVLRRLAQIAAADRGALPVQRELVQVNDVVRSVLPLARAAAERRGSRVDVALEPGLPRASADRVRLAEALAIIVVEAADASGPQHALSVATIRAQRGATITVAPLSGSDGRPSVGRVYADRLIEAQGGTIGVVEDHLEIHIVG